MGIWLFGIPLLVGCSAAVPNEIVNAPSEQVSTQLESKYEAPLIAVSKDEIICTE